MPEASGHRTDQLDAGLTRSAGLPLADPALSFPASESPGQGLLAELDQVRLESGTLYEAIRLIASSPDLDRILDGLVGLLTKATRCHACFIYLRRGDRLRLRAASQLYSQLIGHVEFGVDEGLAGWAVRHNRIAFIRENAMDDPRTNHVPELEEERFQSMVAVPIPARGGSPIGVIVLHTIAPREFDQGTLDLLSHAAPLLAGALENAQLYEEARRRVSALTALAALSQQIAAVEEREELYRTATDGVRALVRADEVRLYQTDPAQRTLEFVASDPRLVDEPTPPAVSGSGMLLELLQQRGRRDAAANARLQSTFAMQTRDGHTLAVPVAAGHDHLGVLVASGFGLRVRLDESEELLRAAAHQLAVALNRIGLIERLTEENIVRELFAALERADVTDADARARQARGDLSRAHVIVYAQRAQSWPGTGSWAALTEQVESALRRLVPGALCDVSGGHLRGLLPLASVGVADPLAGIDELLRRLGSTESLAIGRGDPQSGADGAADGLRQAADASRVASALCASGGALAHSELGAYRYLVHLAEHESRNDPYLDAVRKLAAYDARRGSQLVVTLEEYLANRRSSNETARALTVHRNTLRQRLDRIESLSGLALDEVDLLALELAIKLSRLRPADAPNAVLAA
jgi:GAF domain-containing protein